MSFVVVGLNHKTAPVAVRERVAFNPTSLPTALQALRDQQGVEEAVILSTCNRTELVCYLPDLAPQSLSSWLCDYYGESRASLHDHLFFEQDADAIRHVFRVACGLDSMVLGEPQILGQLKEAYRLALDHGAVGKMLNRLMQHSFTAAKRVRTDTAIGSSPVSVAFAAVRLAQQVFGELQNQCALLVGAGETIELVAQHLSDNQLGRMIVANRSLERAQTLASRYNGYALPLEDLQQHLVEADILITSTASPQALIDKAMVKQALKRRKHRPIFMVDIAVPRDIDAAVGDLDDVYLYTVDDLQAVIEENRRSRESAAQQAEEIVLTETHHFLAWTKSLDAAATVQVLRQELQAVQGSLMDKARRQLQRGEDPEQVMEGLLRAVSQRFLHAPSVALREANGVRQEELIRSVKELFALPEASVLPDLQDRRADTND